MLDPLLPLCARGEGLSNLALASYSGPSLWEANLALDCVLANQTGFTDTIGLIYIHSV